MQIVLIPWLEQDTIIKVAAVCGAFTVIGVFLHKTYLLLKGLVSKLTQFIDAEISLRKRFEEMYDWYQRVKVYADVRVLSKEESVKSSAAGAKNG